MIERDGDTIQLRQNPRAVAAVGGAIIVVGLGAIGLGVLMAVGPLLLGLSAWVEIMAVIGIGFGLFLIVAVLRGDKDREVLELDATALRARRGEEIIGSVSRASVSSLTNYVAEGTRRTTGYVSAYDEQGDLVASWHLNNPWSKREFDAFLEATGIRNGVRR